MRSFGIAKLLPPVMALLTLVTQCALTSAQAAQPKDPSADQKMSAAAASRPIAPMLASEARHAQLVADSQRLTRMSAELKAEVAQGKKDILPLDLVMKLSAIEALAHSLKDRLKTE